MFGASNCTITLGQPKVLGEAVDAEIYKCEGEIPSAILFIPGRQSGIHITIFRDKSVCKVVTLAEIEKFQFSSKQSVKIEKGLAEVITSNGKNFDGLDELKKKYPHISSIHFLAQVKLFELYFGLDCGLGN